MKTAEFGQPCKVVLERNRCRICGCFGFPLDGWADETHTLCSKPECKAAARRELGLSLNALVRTFQAIFDPLPTLPGSELWKFVVSEPLLHRLDALGPGWHREEAVATRDAHMTIIGARAFWAKQLGFIEFRKRSFRSGWWYRLTPLGLRYLRQEAE